MELGDLVGVLRRRWWVPLLCAAVAVAAAVGLGTDDTVRSSGVLVVGTAEDLEGEGARFSAADTIDAELINTFADLAEGSEVVAAAAEAAGVDPDGLAVHATPGPDAKTIQVAVEGEDEATVEALAAAVMTEAGERLVSLYDIYRVEVVDAAGPATATAPSRVATAGVAAVLGLAAGMALALAGALAARGRVESRRADEPS